MRRTSLKAAAGVKCTPLLMKPELVRATFEDRKTATRRMNGLDLVNEYPDGFAFDGFQDGDSSVAMFHSLDRQHAVQLRCPYGGPGDRLWVREQFKSRTDVDWATEPEKAKHYALYRADDMESDDDETHWHDYGAWKPSIHMPRCLSRLTLEIRELRVERLQQITIDDIGAEGVQMPCTDNGLLLRVSGKNLIYDYLPDGFFLDKTPLDKQRIGMVVRANFASTWDCINFTGSWKHNPFVWVITFKRLEATCAE